MLPDVAVRELLCFRLVTIPEGKTQTSKDLRLGSKRKWNASLTLNCWIIPVLGIFRTNLRMDPTGQEWGLALKQR